jgi:bifunctional non-homologous end joining protein LigD
MSYKRIEGGSKFSVYVTPMLAQLTDRPAFDDPNWVFEVKWDGYRAIAEVQRKGNRLYSRNGLSFSAAYSKVFSALGTIKDEVILDGEIVVVDASGKPSFQLLQNYSNKSSVSIFYYVFDCLRLNGRDLTRLPLLERKEILKKLLPQNRIIRYCDHVEESGVEMFKAIQKQALEGMIAKRSDSLYYPGKRTPYWLKIKNVLSEEAIIIGFTAPKGSRKGFGSLLLGQYAGKKLVYIGNVGTGFTGKILQDLHRQMKPLIRTTSPLDIPVKVSSDSTWVDPVLVCNIKYTEKTSDGIVRHCVFLGLRVDKSPRAVKTEKKS